MPETSPYEQEGHAVETVTFMFTDIEGSTGLWDQLGDRFRCLLAHHNEIVRDMVARWGGEEVKTQGDSFMIAFADVCSAVECAVHIQRALANHEWTPELAELLVRIGIHTGDVLVSSGADGRPDYLGLAVNLAHRVSEAGHGGQILLSSAAHSGAEHRLDEDVELVDLGRHRLRGLARPEQLYEVRHAQLPSREFPPLRTLEYLRTNLPAQLTTFVGRETEITELKKQLGKPGTRLITLTGVGGCGKTRLALEVGADLLDAYRDGIWLVALAPLTDPELVPQIIATALNVREEPTRPLLESLIDRIQGKQLLLILDNCEHLIEACARVAQFLLERCPTLRILATSREALGVPGERAWHVPSLAVPDPGTLEERREDLPTWLTQYESARLLIQRATLSKRGFTVTRDNARAVAEICQRLDGIPLALELAAARMRVFSPQQIAVRLDDRFRLLTGGSRTALPRQQTLRAAIDWSYDLLCPPERALFQQVSVFVGGWTLEAAQAVCVDDAVDALAVIDGLAALVEKSLVIAQTGPDGDVRYRLPETIRQYGGERLLDSGQGAEVRDRHLAWAVKCAERAGPHLRGGRDHAMWLDRTESEHDNLRAALEWGIGRAPEEALRLAVAVWWYWMWRGHAGEGYEWLDKALAQATEAAPALRGGALAAAGSMAWLKGEPQLAAWHHEASLDYYREAGDQWGIAFALNNVGVQSAMQGDYGRAKTLFEDSLRRWREMDDPWGIAMALLNLGTHAAQQGEHDDAMRLLQESASLAQELGDTRRTGNILLNLGEVARHQGDYEEAEAFYEGALAHAREMGDRHLVALALHDLGEVATHLGDHERAARLLTESMALWRELMDRTSIAECLESFARAAFARAQCERAARLGGAAEALREAVGSVIVPAERAGYESAVAEIRESVGEQAFGSAWAEGRAMDLEQAIGYALQEAPDA